MVYDSILLNSSSSIYIFEYFNLNIHILLNKKKKIDFHNIFGTGGCNTISVIFMDEINFNKFSTHH